MTLLSRRSAVALGLALPAAATLPTPAGAEGGMPVQGAGFYGFRLGEARCAVVSDGAVTMELPVHEAMAANAPREEVERILAERFLPSDRAIVHFNAVLIDTGRNKVLIDAGCATSFGPSAGRLAANLKAAGVEPGSVDTVVISHAHPDHHGGLLTPEGAHAFPSARVLIAADEFSFWAGAADLSRSVLAPEMKQQLIDSARRHLAAVRDRLASGSRQLLVTSDAVHLYATALPRPEWQVSFDTDPDLASETRRKLLERAAAERLPVLAYHFPFPGLGHVGRAGEGYGWEPIIWSWDPGAELG